MPVFVEEWGAGYGSPYMVSDGEEIEGATLVEDGDRMLIHDGDEVEGTTLRLAFVDGVRRNDVVLYQQDPDSGATVRGAAGTYAVGAVTTEAGEPMIFAGVEVRRLVIWGSGAVGDLPPVRGGFSWAAASIDSDDVDAPLQELQTRMREAEAGFAERLAKSGYRVVCDGPLTFLRRRDLTVTGLVKTHTRALLAPEHHRRIAEVGCGQRTSIFALGSDRYSCYTRLAAVRTGAGPWYGVIRLEFPQSGGLEATVAEANLMSALLPRYAGVPHKDPRAPQNLVPVGALEKHLRHRMGDSRLSVRAVREAVALLNS